MASSRKVPADFTINFENHYKAAATGEALKKAALNHARTPEESLLVFEFDSFISKLASYHPIKRNMLYLAHIFNIHSEDDENLYIFKTVWEKETPENKSRHNQRTGQENIENYFCEYRSILQLKGEIAIHLSVNGSDLNGLSLLKKNPVFAVAYLSLIDETTRNKLIKSLKNDPENIRMLLIETIETFLQENQKKEASTLNIKKRLHIKERLHNLMVAIKQILLQQQKNRNNTGLLLGLLPALSASPPTNGDGEAKRFPSPPNSGSDEPSRQVSGHSSDFGQQSEEIGPAATATTRASSDDSFSPRSKRGCSHQQLPSKESGRQEPPSVSLSAAYENEDEETSSSLDEQKEKPGSYQPSKPSPRDTRQLTKKLPESASHSDGDADDETSLAHLSRSSSDRDLLKDDDSRYEFGSTLVSQRQISNTLVDRCVEAKNRLKAAIDNFSAKFSQKDDAQYQKVYEKIHRVKAALIDLDKVPGAQETQLEALIKTSDFIEGKISPQDYIDYAQTVGEQPSWGVRILGGLMLAAGIALTLLCGLSIASLVLSTNAAPALGVSAGLAFYGAWTCFTHSRASEEKRAMLAAGEGLKSLGLFSKSPSTRMPLASVDSPSDKEHSPLRQRRSLNLANRSETR